MFGSADTRAAMDTSVATSTLYPTRKREKIKEKPYVSHQYIFLKWCLKLTGGCTVRRC